MKIIKDLVTDLPEIFTLIGRRNNRIPLSLFLLISFNVLLAPAVQAAAPGEMQRWQAYTVGILGLVVVALCIYLFVVIFQPERF
ncbi:MAG: K(+)-transporting ATPase subunit F [Methylacidiphilales bacterium]|nr:K(+)-transporting ATPase subunit F [Candidatus Methylacidiphilales bacterium]NJR18237.1 K(+)-transporting ATPase subunit F [Calothrix sp. CSU_2_0]